MTNPDLPALASRLRSALARAVHEVRVYPRRDTGTVVVDLTAGEAERLCEMVERRKDER